MRRYARRFGLAACCLWLAGCTVGTQPRQEVRRVRLDRSFGDRGLIALNDGRSRGSVVRHATDGSVFVGGVTIPQREQGYDWVLMKFTEHGDAYRSYNANVAVELKGWGGSIDDVAVMADGAVLVAGDRARPGKGPQAVLVRFTREGRIDRRFGRSGVLSVHLEGGLGPNVRLFRLGDGSVLVTRYQFRHPNDRFDVFRIDARGRRESALSRRTRLPTIGHPSLAVDARGRLVGAETDSPQGVIQVFRLDDKGHLDEQFGRRATHALRRFVAGVPPQYRGVDGMAIDGDGGIVIVLGTWHGDAKLVRLLDDGAVDQDFASGDELDLNGVVLDLATDPAGGTVVTGVAGNAYPSYLLRARPDGRPDRRFGSREQSYASAIDVGAEYVLAEGLDVDGSGRILVTGSRQAYPMGDDDERLFVARYLIL